MSEVQVINRTELKSLLLKIVECEKEKKSLSLDQAELRTEMKRWVPDHKLIKYIFILGLNKNYTDQEVAYLQQASDLLGLPAMCEWSLPIDIDDQAILENRKHIFEILQRWRTLNEEKAEYSNNLKDMYTLAKAKGISVPCVKKLVDFCLNPSKLELYRETNPLLESYMDAVEDVL